MTVETIAKRIALKSPGSGFDYPVFVERLLVGEGEPIAAGRPFAIVVSAAGRKRILAAPMDGTIAEIHHGYGASLKVQSPIAILETFAALPKQKPAPRRPETPSAKPRNPGPTTAATGPAARPNAFGGNGRVRDEPSAPEAQSAQSAQSAQAEAVDPRPAKRQRVMARAPVRDVLMVATPGFRSGPQTATAMAGTEAVLWLLGAALFLASAFVLAANAGYALPGYQSAILTVPIALTIGSLMALTVIFHGRTAAGRRLGETALGLGMGTVIVVAMHAMFYAANEPDVLQVRHWLEIEPLVTALRDQFSPSAPIVEAAGTE